MSYSSRLRSSTSTGLPGRNLAISTPTSAATPAEDQDFGVLPHPPHPFGAGDDAYFDPFHSTVVMFCLGMKGDAVEEPLDLCAKSRWSDLVALYTPTGSHSTSCRAVSMLSLEPDLKVLFKKQISGRGPPYSSCVALLVFYGRNKDRMILGLTHDGGLLCRRFQLLILSWELGICGGRSIGMIEGLRLPLQGVVDGNAASLLWQNFGKGGSNWRVVARSEAARGREEENALCFVAYNSSLFRRTNFSRKPIVKRRNGELVRLQETLLRRRWKKINDVAQKKTVKEARLRLEKEMEMVLVVEKLQELRSLRIQKLKTPGHLFPEDDDAFTESVRAAVEAEERQAGGATAEAFPANAEEQTTRNPSTDDENTIKEATPQPSNTKRSEELDQRLPPDLYRYYYGSRIDMGTRGLSTPGISYLSGSKRLGHIYCTGWELEFSPSPIFISTPEMVSVQKDEFRALKNNRVQNMEEENKRCAVHDKLEMVGIVSEESKSTETQSQSLQQHGPATLDSENIEPKAKSFVHTSVQARIETPQLILHLSSSVLENGNLASERATQQSTHGNAEKSVHQLDEEFQKFCEISKSVRGNTYDWPRPGDDNRKQKEASKQKSPGDQTSTAGAPYLYTPTLHLGPRATNDGAMHVGEGTQKEKLDQNDVPSDP
ncbi:hypothetical protein SELMODRAFT_410370 [Selaginella moellendorffii]|uniref:Uncharacterized protein n=1 Tax=Selaginella moellendorffii TaxID=88036 RepID=D8REJ4_SELML|nr:hypothetical protein SELMODRAFT_410370 [Selaginella moellendorffii]